MGSVFQDIFAYYGLDWLTMVFGLWGTYLITNHKPVGFAINFVSALCAFAVASLSGQYGFIVYNFLFMMVALKGYFGWVKPEGVVQIQAAE